MHILEVPLLEQIQGYIFCFYAYDTHVTLPISQVILPGQDIWKALDPHDVLFVLYFS